MTLEKIVEETFEKLKAFKVDLLLPSLKGITGVYDGALYDDILNINGCANYQFSLCLIDLLKPKQVVELGGAMGAWSLCVLHTLPKDSRLYSITLAEDGKEFMFVVDKYENFYPIVGDDLDISNWKGVDLSKTDIWYFDSLHSEEQLRKELELYSPFFKKGAFLLFDDIHQNEGMEKVWQDVQKKYETMDLTDPCHWTGWGVGLV